LVNDRRGRHRWLDRASYGPDPVDVHRRAAAYVDRILNAEKPADLPVQAPTKYELVINLKTVKASPLLLARAERIPQDCDGLLPCR
jgi:putative ABC transport system substrate-binding protein